MVRGVSGGVLNWAPMMSRTPVSRMALRLFVVELPVRNKEKSATETTRLSESLGSSSIDTFQKLLLDSILVTYAHLRSET